MTADVEKQTRQLVDRLKAAIETPIGFQTWETPVPGTEKKKLREKIAEELLPEKMKEQQLMPVLPWDMIVEILSWLPPKSLCRSGLVRTEFPCGRIEDLLYCEGLLLCELGKPEQLYLVNPATGEAKKLPEGPKYLDHKGFGFDHSANDYKVVCAVYPKRLDTFDLVSIH
ncbi:hypothetical protein ACFX14_007325 [Malus domestica]